MPKYQVLQPIEKNNVMYVPKAADLPAQAGAPKQLPSGGHGKPIPVDASGEIELTEDEASILVHGQVPMFQGKPDPIGGPGIREKQAKEEAHAAAKAAAEKAEYDEFQAFKVAKAVKQGTSDREQGTGKKKS